MDDLSLVYEREDVRRTTGDTIRPGGLSLTDRAIAFCALPPGAHVLDVGCGLGETVAHLTRAHGLAALGLDPSATLTLAGHHIDPARPLIRGVGERIPLAEDSLDALLAECSLSLMADIDRALAEFHRVLKPGGFAITADVYARSTDGFAALRDLPMTSCIRGAIPQADLIRHFESNGFELALWEDHSAALRQLAVEIIMTHGSMDWFWARATCGITDLGAVHEAVSRIRPGYYLLIARKIDI